MKKLFLNLIAIAILLTSCSQKNKDEMIYDYSNVKNLIIDWKQIFDITDNNHFVYIYSETCGYCNQIKQEVITFALKSNNFYFVTYSKGIPIIENRYDVIDKSDLEGLGIIGTPSLFYVVDYKISQYYVGKKEVLELINNLSEE